jgi:hypothetical protein
MHESRKSENNSWVVTPGGEAGLPRDSSMVDILSGPNAPLATAFQMCGWQVAVLDKAVRSSDNLDSTARQQELRDQVQSATFVDTLHPAHHLAIPKQELARQGKQLPDDELLHTGGEDWPDAYRLTPMDPEDAEACVVTYLAVTCYIHVVSSWYDCSCLEFRKDIWACWMFNHVSCCSFH